MLSWVALAYSLKFLWAPIVDRYDVPVLARLLGRRRGWMALAQLVIALGLVGIALSDPATSLGLTIASRASRRLRVGHAGRGHRRLAHRRRPRPPARA